MRLKAILGLGGLMLTLGACGRPDPGSHPTPVPAEGADPGYRAAPQVLDVARAPDGGLVLSGRAPPSSHIRLASPAGSSVETTADRQGVWRAALGPVSEGSLYGLSAETGGRRVQAEGYVAVLPGAQTAALLRAGSGAQVLGAGGSGLRLLAIDVDSGGAAVVSGVAPAGSPVRLLVDGAPALDAAVRPDGGFSQTLPKALPPGPHRFQALSGQAAASAAVAVGPIAPLTQSPYRIAQASGGWRIDWITPGEGLQTTLLMLGAVEASR